MTQPKANKFIHLLSRVLLATMKQIGELPERNVYCLKEQLKSFTDVLLDGTERPHVGINLWQDTGFQGHLPENVNVLMPIKKPKGKELSDEQKKENKKISSSRVIVEHAIGGVKRCRIVKDRFRCYKMRFEDSVMLIAWDYIISKL
ncbi:MAG: transposase family protein [Bacteroidota bacterium]|nr:transposase family protein [Bacteroidota bacterium]